MNTYLANQTHNAAQPTQCADSAGTKTTTRAFTQSRYGAPDTLSLTRQPKPEPGRDQVLVRVHASRPCG